MSWLEGVLIGVIESMVGAIGLLMGGIEIDAMSMSIMDVMVSGAMEVSVGTIELLMIGGKVSMDDVMLVSIIADRVMDAIWVAGIGIGAVIGAV